LRAARESDFEIAVDALAEVTKVGQDEDSADIQAYNKTPGQAAELVTSSPYSWLREEGLQVSEGAITCST
jgi:hypothetical protein